MHPGNRILIYVLTALVIPGLTFFQAILAGLGALAAIALGGRSPWRLLWRTRWLFIVLVLGYGYSLPGEAALAVLGEWGPTRPGLLHGLQRAMHLMALLLWLDVLVLGLSAPRLLAGLDSLMRPVALLGADTRRIALRLALTLQAIESLEHARACGGGGLRDLFSPSTAGYAPERVVLESQAYRARDYLVMLAAVLAALMLVRLRGHV